MQDSEFAEVVHPGMTVEIGIGRFSGRDRLFGVNDSVGIVMATSSPIRAIDMRLIVREPNLEDRASPA